MADTPAREFRTILAFDYGTTKIGVAVGQELTCTASSLTTLFHVNKSPDWNAIAGLIESWRPDALVVGVPYHMDGTEHEITHAARRFGRQLHGRYGLPVHEMDERLSSREARAVALDKRARGVRRKAKKGDIDQVAAQIILQDWLQQQETCGGSSE
jgi:putative Holliday junction resolvase